jgi:FlaG/FlaF family flagellin (archaellin)
MPAPASAVIPDEIVSLSYPDLVSRQEYIDARLNEIALPVRASKTKPTVTAAGGPKKRKLQSAAAAVVSAAETAADTSTADTTAETTTTSIPKVPIVTAATKTADIHWDFLMKEMMWLATDFQAERKRHGSSRRRLCNGIRLVYKSKAIKAARELTDAETKRRKLANRLGREVKGWWTKIERVVSYKQKLSAEQERQAAMNKQLVALVKQTERYSESLARQDYDDDDNGSDDSGDDDDDDSGTENKDQRSRRKKHHRKKKLTIEEALSSAPVSRRSKTRVTDYARMQLEKGDESASFYGESTAESGDNSGSDVSEYTPEKGGDDSDDETTFLQAQAEETQERRQRLIGKATTQDDDSDNDDDKSFVADPVELLKLQEESTMDVDQVLERLRDEGMSIAVATTGSPEPMDVDDNDNADEKDDGTSKRVSFAPAMKVEKESTASTGTLVPTNDRTTADETTTAATAEPVPRQLRSKRVIAPPPQLAKPDPGTDADDDGDASDVEDFVDLEEEVDAQGETSSRDGSEEFVADTDGKELDDETTMAQEESLPSQMTAEEEIQMLNEENEMSVEELRQKYAAAMEANDDEDEVEVEGEAEDENDSLSEADVQDRCAGYASPSLEEQLAVDDTGEEDEFAPATDGTDVDDETTFEAEEKLGRDMTYEEELAMLQNEGEMPIEQLRAMYASVNNNEESEGDDEEMESEQEEEDSAEDTAGSALHELAAAQVEDGDNDEFEPNEGDGDAVDDETTMDAEEKLAKDMSYDEEIALLKRESEMTVDELKAMYAGMNDEGADEQSGASDVEMDEDADEASVHDDGEATMSDLFAIDETAEEQENDDEFSPGDRDEQDDEATMEAEDRLGQEMSPEEELAMLKEQSEIPIESLRSMYQHNEEGEGSSTSTSSLTKRKRDSETEDADAITKKTRRDLESDDTDTGMAALEALEASAERAQKTLASRPYLLTPWVKLREYQQIGLNWLVSLQSRRLNGILADGES